jgi:L-ascorbate metabolism protein UlaG (beta-lactamase superfamily)
MSAVKWKESDHYRDGRFFNPGVALHSFRDIVKWMRHRDPGPWRPFVAGQSGPEPPERVDDGALRVTFVNHATLLLQVDGVNLLTDPVWSERASPVQWMGPRRHRAPGIRFADLPPIDAVLLTHNHYDHLDTGTLRRLAKRGTKTIFCPLGNGRMLRCLGFREIHEMDWWESVEWRGLTVHAMPAQHFAARTPFDRNKTLWCGWMVEAASGKIYLAGDTGFGPHFAEIASRFPVLRLALLPIGAYRPEWFMGPIHMSPDEAVAAHRMLGAERSVAMHFGTFPLADDGETEPVERLQALLGQSEDRERFWVLREGEGRDVPELACEACSGG